VSWPVSAFEPVLELADLRTGIKLRHAVAHPVDGVSLRVGQGETLGIVGESGCGKTITALSIMRLLPPGGRISAGSIRFGGTDLARLADPDMRVIRGNRIAMIFQDPMTSLNPCLTIGEQVAEPVVLHRGASREQARRRAEEVLELVGLPRARERLPAYPHVLSGGMRQRVMIAMALACEPELLIADEPTSALDVTLEAQILALLRKIRADRGLSILFVTHDLSVVAQLCDRVVVMYAGQVVEQGAVADVFSDPRHPYTEALLSAVPARAHRGRTLATVPGQVPSLLGELTGCRFATRCRYQKEICHNQAPRVVGSGASEAVRCHMRDPSSSFGREPVSSS
jgi:peptide/nickel transport system ATP-binding protein